MLDAVKGLPYYGPEQFAYSCLACIVLTGINLVAVNYNYVRIKMIVGVEIDDDKKTVTLFTRNLLTQLSGKTYRFHQIKIRNGKDKSKDGLDFLTDVRCGVFTVNRIIVGRFFIDHFTWPENEALLNDIIRKVHGIDKNQVA